MLRGSLIFASFALKKDIRLKRTHIFRFACIGIVFLILFSSWLTSSRISSPGLDFFTKIVWLNFWLVTLAGIGFFSTAITEEKEENTLPLLQLAGLNTLALLLGKSTVRALRVILLLLGQLPFLMLAIALGGITPLQIYATIIAMIAYVILIANFSLLCSVYANRSGIAISLVVAALFIFFISPYILTKISVDLQSRGYLGTNDLITLSLKSYCDLLIEFSVIERIRTILSTGYSESVINAQVVSNCLIGIFCFLTAWILFARCTENNPTAKKSRRSLNRKGKMRKTRPGRLAIAWKDFHLMAGGTKVLWIKSLFYLSVILLLVGGGIFLDRYSHTTFIFRYSWKELMGASLFFLISGFVIECTIYSSRIFREERTQKILPLLTLLPHSLVRLAYEKIWGCSITIIPVFVGICLIVLLEPDSFSIFLGSGLDSLLILFFIQFAVFLHLLTYFSILVRWGALAFAIGAFVLLESCATPFLHITFLLFDTAIGDAGILFPAFYFSLMICFVLQILIAKRLHQIAAED
ncbi:MAG: hypothetical protein K0U86_11885 [Planctomycetes bacterium]|nr:hypothetical protein [Planctomycetota bacterium]MCH9725584.1 hypothetical protein [Planctomycetota bacterium]MCH9777638.1 hypothetical protein [Planctomycetota bacterium]